MSENETCNCKNGTCECGSDCHCGCDCGGEGYHFHRRYQTKAEQIEKLEAYLVELKLEVLAVEEHIADLQK